MFHIDDEVIIEKGFEQVYGTIYAILGGGLYSVILETGDVQEFWEDELS